MRTDMRAVTEGWIGVDLDGTLAMYDGWHGIEHIGEPILPMVRRVKEWLEGGIEVRIMTARVSGKDVEFSRFYVMQWCHNVFGKPLRVTNEKDYQMMALWDDRCRQVEFNTGIPV